VLEFLLRERTPEERQRLVQAWERVAGGDPDSLPAIYALADRFSLEAHAALLAEIQSIHGSLEGMAREIGKGAAATVDRTEAAAKAALDHAGRFEKLIPKLETIIATSGREANDQLRQARTVAEDIATELRDAKQDYAQRETWRYIISLALLTVLLTAAGFLLGGKLYEWHEVERLHGLIHQWQRGDREAAQAIGEEMESYRLRHGLEQSNPHK
jgi:hypothetical protein